MFRLYVILRYFPTTSTSAMCTDTLEFTSQVTADKVAEKLIDLYKGSSSTFVTVTKLY